MGHAFIQDWSDAKDEYYRLTRQKKPRESFLKFFSTSHTGLSSSIEALAHWKLRREEDQTVKAYVGLLEDYRKAMDKYLKTLDKLIKEEEKKNPKRSPAQDDDLKMSDMLKGLEMLKAKLEKYRASFELKLKELNQEAAQTSQRDRLVAVTLLEMKRGFAHFRAAAKTVAVTPTLEVYNREFGTGKAAVKLEAALKTRLKLAQDPRDKELAERCLELLAPWGENGPRRLLEQQPAMLQSLKNAVQAVEQVSKLYKIA